MMTIITKYFVTAMIIATVMNLTCGLMAVTRLMHMQPKRFSGNTELIVTAFLYLANPMNALVFMAASDDEVGKVIEGIVNHFETIEYEMEYDVNLEAEEA